jgi:hypothetical protein
MRVNNKKTMNTQERYEGLYMRVQQEIKELGLADNLLKVCSVEIDRKGNDNQVNVEFLLPTKMDTLPEVKKRFDKYAGDYGFTMNYVNLSGDVFDQD